MSFVVNAPFRETIAMNTAKSPLRDVIILILILPILLASILW